MFTASMRVLDLAQARKRRHEMLHLRNEELKLVDQLLRRDDQVFRTHDLRIIGDHPPDGYQRHPADGPLQHDTRLDSALTGSAARLGLAVFAGGRCNAPPLAAVAYFVSQR